MNANTGEMKVVYTLEKNSRETVHFYLQTYKGERLAQIRTFVDSSNDEERPTPKGIAFRVGDIMRLVEGVHALASEVEAERL